MKIIIDRETVGDKIIRITERQIEILRTSVRPIEIDKKLWRNRYDTVTIQMIRDFVNFRYTHSDSPGYLVMVFNYDVVRMVINDWIYNPILNKSGLAAQIWDDGIPNNLRRRLDQKVDRRSLTETERARIIEVVKNFADDVEKSLKF